MISQPLGFSGSHDIPGCVDRRLVQIPSRVLEEVLGGPAADELREDVLENVSCILAVSCHAVRGLVNLLVRATANNDANTSLLYSDACPCCPETSAPSGFPAAPNRSNLKPKLQQFPMHTWRSP